MQTRTGIIVLLTGLFMALAGAGNAVADTPRGGARYAGHHAPVRVHPVKRHRAAHVYRQHAPRARSYARYRSAPRYVGHFRPRLHPGAYRYRSLRWAHHGRYRHHRHHRHINAGAVVAGAVLGGLVYELIKSGDREDVYYEEVYYRK